MGWLLHCVACILSHNSCFSMFAIYSAVKGCTLSNLTDLKSRMHVL